jgi:DNA-binding NtrC family response regulator
MTLRGPNPKTVVLVEPEAASRDLFRQGLIDAGFEVVAFPDYAGALSLAEGERRLDLLITGVRLPAGTPHGLALAAMVHMRRPRLPVLFIADDTALAQMAADAAPVLVKPIGAAELVQAATQIIGERFSS